MIEYINSLDTGGQFETDAILARKTNEIINYINDNEIKINNYISKDKIREVLEKERKKQKERTDISLALHSQYISLIDKIKKTIIRGEINETRIRSSRNGL